MEAKIAGLALESQGNYQDDARQLNLELSANGAQWGAPVMEGKGAALFEIIFKAPSEGPFYPHHPNRERRK
ncbi:MAG: hypothetical protein QE570_20390 [Verrucomicrobiota bacterium]|nr:hypothetical protein [Verrucomicrobiota bacterium]